jgi:hypothetical protein
MLDTTGNENNINSMSFKSWRKNKHVYNKLSLNLEP